MRAIRASAHRGVIPALLLGAAVSLGVIGLSRIGVFSGWETRAVDAFQFLRDREAPAEIVLVHIDEDAFRELGERQPLSRRYLADLADFLMRSGARVVVLDILLQVPSLPDEDEALVTVARRGADVSSSPGRRSRATARRASRSGRTSHRPSTGRRASSMPRSRAMGSCGASIQCCPAGGDAFLPSLALVTVAAHGGVEPALTRASARRRPRRGAPVAGGGRER